MLSLASRETHPSPSGEVVLELATRNWGAPSAELLHAIHSELRELGAALLLLPSHDARTSLSLLMPDGAEAFRITSGVADVPAALLESLQIAGQSTRLQRGRRAPHSKQEVVFYSLVGALSLIFGDGCEKPAPSRGPEPLALA